MKSQQGTKFITQEDSANYSPDYSQKDLYEAIERGKYPKWSVQIQTMTPKEGGGALGEAEDQYIQSHPCLAPEAIPTQEGWRVRPQRERHQLFRGNRAGCLQPLSHGSRNRTFGRPSPPVMSLFLFRHPSSPHRCQLSNSSQSMLLVLASRLVTSSGTDRWRSTTKAPVPTT